MGFPKATDQSFAAKLHENLLGKCENFQKANPRPDPNAHFAVVHYAATVSYNLTGWLFKNKDPLNDTVVEMLKNGSNALMVRIFEDHPGQPTEVKKDAGGGGKKKGGGKTVSSFYKSQLDDLMKTLYATDPAFIRCVVPNTHKIPGGVEPGLVMHQYQCNGVLAGIAICRAGFPNKVLYPEFKERYNILAAAAVAKAKKDKDAAGAVMKVIQLDPEKFRLGHTKVFFRAGILGYMEEVREDRIGEVLSWLQAQARGKASRLVFKKLQDQKLALYCLQRTIRNYYIGKTWLWWQLWLAIKPNLKCTKFAQYKAEYEEKIAIAEANIDKAIAECNKVKAVYEKISAEKNELVLALQSGGSAVQDIIDKTNRIEAQKNDLQKQMDETQARIRAEEDQIASLEAQSAKVKADADKLAGDVKTLESTLEATEEDKMTKDNQIRTLKEEIAHQEDMIAKLQKEKRGVAEARQKTEEDIQSMEDKCNHLNKVKGKLEQALDECEDGLEREKKAKGDVEKLKRKTDGDLKLTQEAVSDLERVKSELVGAMQRKDKEIASVSSKIDDEATLGAKYAKQVKELQGRLEELDEELTIERANRAKAEKNRATLSRDIGDLAEKLEDAGNNTATQIELNKKREAELAKLKGDLDESNIAHEGTLAALRQKHNNNMAEADETIDGLTAKIAATEKSKARLEVELEDLQMEYERVHAAAIITEKRGKTFDKVIGEWKAKHDDLVAEVDASHKEARNVNSDLFRVKAGLEETTQQLDIVKRETKNLADEIKDLLDQLGDGGRSIHELDKQRRRLEVEKEELQAALEEAEGALEQEENKVLRAQLELGQVRQEIDRKIAEKVEEFDNTRKNHQRAMDSLQASLEGENKAKTEALRVKKKLETDINELEIALDHANKANAEAHKSVKRFQGQLRDVEVLFEAESRQTAELAEKAGLADRRGAALLAELEESNALLDSASRGKKQADAELVAARGSVNDMTAINGKAAADKRKLESAVHTLHAEIDDALAQAKGSEEKAKRAMVDAARLAYELRAEQDHTAALGKGKAALTATMGELELNLGAANEVAAKGGRSTMAKLENRIHELEIELGAISAKTGETMKAFHRAERHVKELSFQGEQDKKNQDSMSDLAGKLQAKIKTYMNQIAEAEEIAVWNLAKFRKAQADLESK